MARPPHWVRGPAGRDRPRRAARAPRDPWGGEPSPWVIHRLMLDGLPIPDWPRVLDAGCGHGATMLHLAPERGGDWTGLTLSAVPAARGNEQVAVQLAEFRCCGRCPVTPTADGWRAALQGAGLDIVAERDRNPLLLSRPMEEVAPRIAEVGRRSRLGGCGVRAAAGIGGLLLETLHADGHLRYPVMAGRKPG